MKFLLSVICSFIFLQLKDEKRKTLSRETTKSFVLCLAMIFFQKNTAGEISTLATSTREAWVCKI